MTEKMTVLLVGNSGAGKSTLISAVAGVDIETRPGEGDTQKISTYESSNWPFVFIDTKGFEYSRLAQLMTIRQVKKFSRDQVVGRDKSKRGNGIDAVWFCVEGTSKRAFSHNVEMMKTAVKFWKNVPVIAVITKSYSEEEDEENIAAVRAAFEKVGNVNLKEVIPIVAKEYRVNDDVVAQRGITELCQKTLEFFSEAKSINKENRDSMVLNQKRFTANALVVGCAAAGSTIGAVPTSFSDSALLVPLETAMAKGIFKIYDINFTGDMITGIIESAVITNVAKALLAKLKDIPGLAAKLATSALNAVVAGVFVTALGESLIALCEAIYRNEITLEKAEDVANYIAQKLNDKPLVAMIVNLVGKGKEVLDRKSAKEVIKAVNGASENAATGCNQ